MLSIMNPSQEIELLIHRVYELRSKRILMWRKERADFRLKYFTTEFVSMDQNGWEEIMDLERRNPYRIEKMQVDAQNAEVVVIHPGSVVEIRRIFYLCNTENGWRVARSKVQ